MKQGRKQNRCTRWEVLLLLLKVNLLKRNRGKMMKEYWLHYTYANADGTNRTVTSCKVKAESESDAKNILKSKYASKGQIIVQWRDR